MTTNARLDALRHAVPEDVLRSPSGFGIDAVEPALAFSPDDRTQVAALAGINRR